MKLTPPPKKKNKTKLFFRLLFPWNKNLQTQYIYMYWYLYMQDLMMKSL